MADTAQRVSSIYIYVLTKARCITMQTQVRRHSPIFSFFFTPAQPHRNVLAFLVLVSSFALVSQAWSWESFADEETLEVLTVDRKGTEHWSTFWLVVIDGKLYLRLGPQGTPRIQKNARQPFVSVRIAGERFDDVRVIETPEMVEPVAAAMAEKYWSDLIIRWVPHPLTVRLERGL